MLASVTTLWAVRLWTCGRNKQWLRLSLLRRQYDHTEGEVPVDRCQLQVGVHTAPSHWYSLWPGLSCCSVLQWELRIEWQQWVYVRNKQWLRSTVTSPATIWSYKRRGSCRSLSVTGWCSHGSFSLVLFVAWSGRVVRFSTGSFGLNGSRECMFGTNSGCDCHFSGDNLIIQKERFL